MDISLIKRPKSLKFLLHVGETHMEGSVSQNFNIGLSFCFIVTRISFFERKLKKIQKLPVFCYKIKTKTLIKILRHSSLDMNVSLTCSKGGAFGTNIKREMHVQKIKVKKLL